MVLLHENKIKMKYHANIQSTNKVLLKRTIFIHAPYQEYYAPFRDRDKEYVFFDSIT